MQEFLRDLGVEVKVRVHADSAAAVGISRRVGLGTQRHIAVNALWIQDRLRRKHFELFKIKGENNPADMMTKHLNAEKAGNCLKFVNAEYREGRPDAAPMVKSDEQLLREDASWQHEDELISEKIGEDELERRLQDQ